MKTKICKICKKEKDISKFPYHQKTKETYRPECRICYNELRRNIGETARLKKREENRISYKKHREKRLQEVKEYQNKPENKTKLYEWNKKSRLKRTEAFKEFKSTLHCVKCEESHISCLEFHHTDPSKKEGLISKMKYSSNKLREELKKCIVLCSNCHRKLHYERNHKNKDHVCSKENNVVNDKCKD